MKIIRSIKINRFPVIRTATDPFWYAMEASILAQASKKVTSHVVRGIEVEIRGEVLAPFKREIAREMDGE